MSGAARVELFIRRRPPPEALRWVERSIGRGAKVESVRRLRGGTSSAMHAIGVRDTRGMTHRAVLRRFVRADWLAEEPDLAEHEAVVLDLLARSDVPAPRLIAVDPDGSECDVPAVLMTRLPGRVDFTPGDVDSWVRQLGEALPLIHAVDSSARDRVRTYAPYSDIASSTVPAWSKRPDAWLAALERVRAPPPAASPRFIHRDYHPANVLWLRGRLSGIVDWANASWGPPGIDVAHGRTDIAVVLGVDAAERFLTAYEAISGVRHDPYWDLVAVFDKGNVASPAVWEAWPALGVKHLNRRILRERLDAYVTSVVARL